MIEKDWTDTSERGEKVKPSMLVIVPSEGIHETGKTDFTFMFTVDVPSELSLVRPYGVLKRRAKSPDYVDPFKLARGESGAIGDDGVARWHINVGARGQQVFAGSVDADDDGLGLADLLKDAPDCVVMVPPEDVEALQQASGAVELEVMRYEGVLSTSS